MAYLDIQLSKQEIRIVAENIPIETDQPAGNVDDAINVDDEIKFAENSNFQIARHLKDGKSRLINALSQFPVTALWLLKEYEQKAYTAEQDDEATLESELTTALADIKKQFYSLSRKVITDASYIVDKQNLVTALQLFPFSFHDLTKLVDVIVYAYKFRGLCYQSSTHRAENNADLILKRLGRFKSTQQY